MKNSFAVIVMLLYTRFAYAQSIPGDIRLNISACLDNANARGAGLSMGKSSINSPQAELSKKRIALYDRASSSCMPSCAKTNGHNAYKDKIRAWELQAHIARNKGK